MNCRKIEWYYWVLALIAILAIGVCVVALCCQKCCTQRFLLVINCLNVIVLVITACVALRTYNRSKKIEEADFLLKLRTMLTSEKNMQIHKALENNTQTIPIKYVSGLEIDKQYPFDGVDLYNYLGTLELANILLEMDIISESSFRSQFGYRIQNINIPAIQSMIVAEGAYWKELKELIKKFG